MKKDINHDNLSLKITVLTILLTFGNLAFNIFRGHYLFAISFFLPMVIINCLTMRLVIRNKKRKKKLEAYFMEMFNDSINLKKEE